MGVDYQSIPTNYTIPAGQQCITQPIIIIADIITEPQETFTISIPTACRQTNSATIPIQDYKPILLSTSGNVNIRKGSSTKISVTASNGISPYSYAWNQGLPASQSHIVALT